MAYIVHEHPEHRGEVVEWFREILRFIAEKLPETRYVDSIMAGFIMEDLLNIQAIELLSEIKAVFDTGLVDATICGNFYMVKKELQQPRFYPCWFEYALDIYEQYDKFGKKWG